MRKFVIMGNWKMNGAYESIKELCDGISQSNELTNSVDVAVFPPSVYVTFAQFGLENTGIGVGVQNITYNDNGAFTGEVSREMVADLGLEYVLIGHSERRSLYGETDADVFKKTQAVIDIEVTPVICIGETLEEREAGKLEEVITTQLEQILANIHVDKLSKIVIAYEPVWAIGTGVVASLDQVQDAHAYIRSLVAKRDQELAGTIRIVYGGSLKSANAKDILSLEDVDGGLIGGASLKSDEFNSIIKQAHNLCSK